MENKNERENLNRIIGTPVRLTELRSTPEIINATDSSKPSFSAPNTPSSGSPKILNSEIKFYHHKLVLTQKIDGKANLNAKFAINKNDNTESLDVNIPSEVSSITSDGISQTETHTVTSNEIKKNSNLIENYNINQNNDLILVTRTCNNTSSKLCDSHINTEGETTITNPKNIKILNNIRIDSVEENGKLSVSKYQEYSISSNNLSNQEFSENRKDDTSDDTYKVQPFPTDSASNNYENKLPGETEVEMESEDRNSQAVSEMNQEDVLNSHKNTEMKCSKVQILPRKRGRPRKKPVLEDNNVSLSTPVKHNILHVNEDNNFVTPVETPELVTSTPVPKKRGRKRKSEQSPPPVIEENFILDESKSGRKRRKVNYLEIVNELDKLDDEPVRKYKFSGHAQEVAKKQKTNTNNYHINVSEDLPKPNITNDNNKEVSIAETNHEISNSIDNNDNSKTEKKAKYKRTGGTVQMVNSVFAAALGNNSQSEKGDNLDNADVGSGNSKTPMVKKRRPGPKRKLEDDENVIKDLNGMVNCISCNKKVDNNEWITHNRQEHNNLAWREGEEEVPLDNENIVSKILTPILKSDKVLKCKKCNAAFNKVKEFISHTEKCVGILSSSGMVTCAVCKMEMEKSKWSNHKQRQHNNLSWRIGDHPLNLNDQNLVMNILTNLYKAKKPLYCEKCGTSKKSVIGYLSHQSQCGLKEGDAKVKCKFCDKRVLPVSMQTHIRMVHETPKEKQSLSDANYFEIDTNARQSKRKAAETAMLVINQFSNNKIVQEYSKHFLSQLNFVEQDFVKVLLRKELSDNNIIKCKFSNCSYESNSVISVMEHMNSCELKPEQYYTCKKCLSIYNIEEEIKNHLKDIHDVTIVDDDYQIDCEDEQDEKLIEQEENIKKGSLYERVKLEKDPNYKVKPTFILNLSKTPNRLFSEAYNFTMSFCKDYYSQNCLYKSLHYNKCHWLVLDDELIEEYLPVNERSCQVARIKTKINEKLPDSFSFKNFEIFEAEHDEGSATIFCGGPVQAMAWMPTPYTSFESTQVLAVATINNFDNKYYTNQCYSDKSVIQFWDFGNLSNKSSLSAPKLMFLLACDFGPIWHLEWCPSGCYDTEFEDGNTQMRRMGLLAVAGSNSAVYIYSIPQLEQDQMGVIYKVKPLLKLCVTLYQECCLTSEKFYASKISWSKASGHKYIAVGYTDGVVALFNLDATFLLKFKDKDCEGLLPFKSFQPHFHMVTVLHLLHLGDGKRWLLTGSFDRNLIVWDLSNGSKVVTKRNIMCDGVWLTNWMSYITVSDESSANSSHVPNLLTAYRDYLYERAHLKPVLSSVKTVSESNWLNGIIYGTALGEVSALFPHQLLHGLDYDKKLKKSVYLFGYTKLVNKHEAPEDTLTEGESNNSSTSDPNKKSASNEESIERKRYEPITYQEVIKKYSLVFCDMEMDSQNNFFDESKKSEVDMRLSKPDLYSLQAINKVAFNPNRQSSLYYAVGYQAGFVKVVYMKFLENDKQVK